MRGATQLGLWPDAAARLGQLRSPYDDGIHVSCDLGDGLPLADVTFDYAVSIHGLQDLPYLALVPALQELRRVLRPGGVLRLGLPDLDRALAAYARGERDYFYIPGAESATLGGKLIVQMVWYGSARTPFTWDFARELLLKAGSTTASARASSSRRSRNARLLVLSPHCDDAVLGVGELLASRPGSVVVTVFAGRPAAGTPLTAWDAAAGFTEGDDVVGIRRDEDRAALTLLAARPSWLHFLDAQYGGPLAADTIVGDVAAAIEAWRPATVAMPLGLFHDDHLTTHEAALRVAQWRRELDWLVYSDALYRRIPGAVEARAAALAAAGIALEPLTPATGHVALKRRAVGCYRSQLRALATPGRPDVADAFEPEQYWRLRP